MLETAFSGGNKILYFLTLKVHTFKFNAILRVTELTANKHWSMICYSYHTGSIAFGALIIAIIQMIRVGLEYLDAKLKGSENAVAKFFLKCLKCCFYCLEKFMKMINKNAYILVNSELAY